MTDLWTFHMLLEDIAPDTEVLEGRVFLNRRHLDREAFIEKVGEFSDLSSAQYWMNLASIDDLLDEVCQDWSMDDPVIEQLGELYRRSWLALVEQRHGKFANLTVEVLRDEEVGDVFVHLRQAIDP